MGNVLDEVAAKFKTLGSAQKEEISGAIAGIRQSNSFLALMSNYDEATKLATISTNSAGSAMVKFGTYQESLQAKTNKLINQLQVLGSTLTNGSIPNGILSFTTDTLKLINALGGLPTVIAATTTALLVLKNTEFATMFIGATRAITAFGAGILNIPTMLSGMAVNFIPALMSIPVKMGAVNASLQSVALATNEVTIATNAYNLSTTATDVSIAESNALLLAKQEAEAALTVQTDLLAASETSAGLAFSSILGPLGLLITAVVMVTSAVSNANKAAKQAVKDQIKAVDDEKEALKSLTAEYNQTKALKETADTKQKLVDIETELVTKYGLTQKQVTQLTGTYEEQTKALKDLTNAKIQEELTIGKSQAEDLTTKLQTPQYSTLSFAGAGISGGSRTSMEAGMFAKPTMDAKEYKEYIIDTMKQINEGVGQYADLSSEQIKQLNQDLQNKLADVTKVMKDQPILDAYLKNLKIASVDYDAVVKDFTDTQKTLFDTLSKQIELKGIDSTSVNNYKTAVDALSASIGKLPVEQVTTFENALKKLQDLQSHPPEAGSQEFVAYANEYMNVADSVNVLKRQIEDTINMSPAMKDAFEKMFPSDSLDKVLSKLYNLNKVNTDANSIMTGYISKMSSLQTSYDLLNKAQSEINNTGNITIETFKKITEGNLLQYLDNSTGKLKINTKSFKDQAQATKEAAIASIKKAEADDISAIATGNLSNLSDLAKKAIKDLSKSYDTSTVSIGNMVVKLVNAIGSLFGIQMAAEKAKGAIDKLAGKTDVVINPKIEDAQSIAEIEAVQKKYASVLKGINATSLSGGDSSGGSKASKASKAAKAVTADVIIQLDKYNQIDDAIAHINEQLTENDRLAKQAIGNTEAQINLLKQRISLTQQEQNLLHDENEKRRNTITSDITKLQKQGIDVIFNPKLNKLEFKQTTQQIQDKINAINLGDPKKSNTLKKELEKAYLESIKLNDSNIKNSETYIKLTDDVKKYNLEVASTGYENEVTKTTDALSNLKAELSGLSSKDYDTKIALISQEFLIQKNAIKDAKDQIINLTNELSNGSIMQVDYTAKVKALSTTIENGNVALRNFTENIRQVNLAQAQEENTNMSAIIKMTEDLIKTQIQGQVDVLNKQKTAYEAQKKAITDLQKVQNDADAEKKKALDNQLSNYEKIIQAEKDALSVQQNANKYAQELATKQKDIANIREKIQTLSLDTTQNAQVVKLQDDLAKKQTDLNTFVADNKIKTQQDALDVELKNSKTAHDKAVQDIADEQAARKSANDQTLADIDARKTANDLAAKELQESIKNSGDLASLAMKKIDKDGASLKDELITYNKKYGDDLDSTITTAWDKVNFSAKGVNSTLEYMTQLIQNIANLSKETSSNLNTMNQEASVRDTLESMGVQVGYNPNTKAVTANNQTINTSGLNLVNGSYQATPAQIQAILAKIGISSPNISIPSSVRNMANYTSSHNVNTTNNKTAPISISSPTNITIQGNADSNVTKQIKQQIDKSQNDMLEKMAKVMGVGGMFNPTPLF